ncbi:hypothetical protein [Leifsonia shinshuensis]
MNEDEQDYTIAALAVIGMIVIAPGAIAAMFEPARVWLVQAHVLTTSGVLVPIGPGAGLDLGRVLILAVIVLALAAGIGLALRKKARDEKRKAQQ